MPILNPIMRAILGTRVGGAFDPLSLFATGEVGVYYDPSDMSTLFQDSAGTIPVTAVEQPVGLVLDKSQGLVLGPEVSGALDLTTAAWTKTGTVTAPTATTASFPAVSDYMYSTAGTTAGATYRIVFTFLPGTGTIHVGTYGNATGDSPLAVSLTLSAVANTTFSMTRYFSSADVDRRVRFGRLGGATATSVGLVSLSVKLLAGNHASQPTAGKQPLVTARVNLCKDTDNASSSTWTNHNVTSAVEAGSDVIGIGASASNTIHYNYQSQGEVDAHEVTFSREYKANTGRYIRHSFVGSGSTNGIYVDVDLVAGAIVNAGAIGAATYTSSAIALTSEGFYRVDVTGVLETGGWAYVVSTVRNSATNVLTESEQGFMGDGSIAFYARRPQLNKGKPTRYQAVYARRNLLTYTKDFENAVWLTNGGIVKGGNALAPDGSMNARVMTASAANGAVYQIVPSAVGSSVTNSIWIRRVTGSGVISLNSPGNVGYAQAVTGEWQRFSESGASSGGGTDVSYLAVTIATLGDSIEIWHPQTELGSVATDYQRINASQHLPYDYTGFPIGLKFDGVDDFMSTAAIDFSGTDKVSAWCGVTKGTVATQGAVYSFGGLPNLGSMEVLNTGAPPATPWAMYADGSFAPVQSAAVSVPDTAVLYQQVDLTGTPKLTGQYNGAPLNAVNNLTSSAMGNYPLHIASRAGTSLFFNGILYSLTGVGKLCTPAEITNGNKLTAKAAGVTL